MREKTEVLIVGLGPVGAALGVYLGRMGVRAIAIERDMDVYPMPRAAHLDHETMRLLNLAGGAEAVSKASQPLSAYEFRNAAGELLMGFSPKGALAPTGWPGPRCSISRRSNMRSARDLQRFLPFLCASAIR